MNDVTKSRALTHYKTERSCIQHAKLNENVAFIRDGKYFTCSRSYVCDCINAGQKITVICYYERD